MEAINSIALGKQASSEKSFQLGIDKEELLCSQLQRNTAHTLCEIEIDDSGLQRTVAI